MRSTIDVRSSKSERTMSESEKEAPELAAAADAGERLRRSIDVVCEDAALVELWACALNGFAQPVPSYGPAPKYAPEPTPEKG